MTISRFQKVWHITRSSHPEEEFRNFLDSLNKDKIVNQLVGVLTCIRCINRYKTCFYYIVSNG